MLLIRHFFLRCLIFFAYKTTIFLVSLLFIHKSAMIFKIFISLMLLSSVVFAQKNYVNHYPNGEIKSKGKILDDSTKTGKWKFYFESGKLKAFGEFDKGVEIGLWSYYYPNGDIWKEESKINGNVTAWYIHPDEIEYKGSMKNSKMHGHWLFYYEDGKQQSEQFFNEGEKIAQWKYWYENGDVWKIISMEKGPVIIYDTTGKVFEEWEVDEGLKNGWYKKYDFWGTILEESQYKNDVRHGVFKLQHGNGNLAIEGQYDEGEKSSIWNYYFTDEKRWKTVNIQNILLSSIYIYIYIYNL